MTVVLDASAVLALVLGERGSSRVVEYLDDAQISAVSHAEVLSRLAYLGVPVASSVDLLVRLRVSVRSFTESQARTVGELRIGTAEIGLSLGDRACVALARQHVLAVVTADRVWAELDLGVEVITVR
ncbi:hypothetical protein MNBD_ACTINO02-1035 [hydrothermal vent metagenome]|uniref:PIN domain-containing protein n=1 Tax=hydrothermal vent metagenome TaxID=652676 RepID=A0A3B0S7Z2_9ZZZZ